MFTQTQVNGGEKLEVPVATATLLPDVPKVFIVFRPSSLSPGHYAAQVIPNLAVQGDGPGARVINLSSRPIQMRLNDSKKMLSPNQSIRVPLIKGKVSVFIPREHKQAEDEADICNETYAAPDGGRLTLLVANAVDNPPPQDEGVMVIPLVEEAPRVAPTGN